MWVWIASQKKLGRFPALSIGNRGYFGNWLKKAWGWRGVRSTFGDFERLSVRA